MTKLVEATKADPVALAAEAVDACKAKRADAHSVELRQVLALEQIADELTAIRTVLVKPAQ